MPQLFPMNWITLTFSILLSTMALSICIYFFKMNMKKNSQKLNKMIVKNTMKW